MIKNVALPATLIAAAISVLATVSGPAQAARDAQATPAAAALKQPASARVSLNAGLRQPGH